MLQELTNACPAHQRGPHRPLHWQSGVEQLLPGPLLLAATHCLQASRQKVRLERATLCGSVLLTDGDTVLSCHISIASKTKHVQVAHANNPCNKTWQKLHSKPWETQNQVL